MSDPLAVTWWSRGAHSAALMQSPGFERASTARACHDEHRHAHVGQLASRLNARIRPL